MGLRAGRKSRRSVNRSRAHEIARLRELLTQLSQSDRPTFDAIIRVMTLAVPARYKKVYNT